MSSFIECLRVLHLKWYNCSEKMVGKENMMPLEFFFMLSLNFMPSAQRIMCMLALCPSGLSVDPVALWSQMNWPLTIHSLHLLPLYGHKEHVVKALIILEWWSSCRLIIFSHFGRQDSSFLKLKALSNKLNAYGIKSK